MLQSAGQFMLAWYNLPFTILIMICVVLAALQWIGLGSDQEHDSDAGHDVDHGVDHDLDHDLSHDLDHSIDHEISHDLDTHLDHSLDHGTDHDLHHDASHEGDHESGHQEGFSVLAYLGIGKAPMMVVLVILFGVTGLLGWAMNGLVQGSFGVFPAAALGLTLPAALLAGSFTSARISRIIGQILPPLSTTATSAKTLVGRRATVVSPWIDQRSGVIRLRDAGGTLISFGAVTDAATPIRRGETVILIDYDPVKKVYTVEKI